MHLDQFDHLDRFPPPPGLGAYEAVAAVLSDDHNVERGLDEARAVAGAVLAESGVGGLTGIVVELSLKLAEAGSAARPIKGSPRSIWPEVWFVA
jgi:hypothetical protein